MANRDFEKSKEWEISGKKLSQAHGFDGGDLRDNRNEFKKAAEAETLAYEILKLANNTLLINERFMEAAFLKIVPSHDLDTLEMATDGNFLYYNSVHICRQYKKAKEIPTRDYMHMILHCVFRHLFVGKEVRPELWDLACDIAVENIINNMDHRSLYCARQESQGWLIRELKEEIPRLTAEWIYKYFDEKDISQIEIEHLRENFHADDHSIWYNIEKSDEAESGTDEMDEEGKDDSSKDDENSNDSGGGNQNEGEEEEGEEVNTGEEIDAFVEGDDNEGRGRSGENKRNINNDQRGLEQAELEKEWEEIARRIELELDTMNDGQGEGYGDLQQNIKEINREKYDYTKLLRKFAVLGENVEINDDEFDYIFYTYGLNLYNDMPLVEPLEYKDVKKIREFVIAIDTSESVSGEIVQKFVTKTWNILKQSKNFFREVNVHIIQCGARVEEDKKIRNQDEFDDYIENMVLRGFGGTDFRPVFEYVDELKRQHEFVNLKGLIYFTDGYGTFPNNPPDYETAFIFIDQGYDLPDVPVWAIKEVLREEEIEQF